MASRFSPADPAGSTNKAARTTARKIVARSRRNSSRPILRHEARGTNADLKMENSPSEYQRQKLCRRRVRGRAKDRKHDGHEVLTKVSLLLSFASYVVDKPTPRRKWSTRSGALERSPSTSGAKPHPRRRHRAPARRGRG